MFRPDLTLLKHALLVVAGHRYWLLPLLPLAWIAFQAFEFHWDSNGAVFPASSVQGQLMGVPLTALGIFFGMRIIAGEIDDRSLEIAYTVPGGCERMWLTKLLACFGVLVVAEAIMALVILPVFTTYPPGALYGALQAASFYMILAMALGALFKSEASGAIVTLGILAFNGMITDFGDNQLRFTPFFNPYTFQDPNNSGSDSFTSAEEILAFTIQNRIAMLLLMAALLGLAFMRSNRRERMLDGM